MAGSLLPIWRWAVTEDGEPVPGALLYTWLSGTSTPQAVYTTAALSTPRTNPVEADADGVFPVCYLSAVAYRMEVRRADGSVLYPAQDDIVGGGGGLLLSSNNTWTGTNTFDNTVTFNGSTNAALKDAANAFDDINTFTRDANSTQSPVALINTSSGNASAVQVTLGNSTSPAGAVLRFYGANHATLPNQLYLLNTVNAALALGVNNAVQLTLLTTGFTSTVPIVASGTRLVVNGNGYTNLAGTISRENASGMVIQGSTGASFDLSFLNPAGTDNFMRVPTGTGHVAVTNSASIGTDSSTLIQPSKLSIADTFTLTKWGISMQAAVNNNEIIWLAFINAGGSTQGSITAVTNSTSVEYNTTSDKRLKRDKGTVRKTSVLSQIPVHEYDWLDSGRPGFGVFAQELAPLVPWAVLNGDKFPKLGGWQVDYSKLVPFLIAGWQDHEDRLSLLEKK